MTREEILDSLKQYKAEYGEKYGIEEIGIFGSLARGQFREDSDVDVVVETKIPDFFALVHIKEELEERFQRHVDIIRKRRVMNSDLKNRIEKEAVYV